MAKKTSAKANNSDDSQEKFPLRLEYREVAELDENPANWRRHPEAQLQALGDVIGEVGWAGALLYNEATGRLIDGHARKKIANGGKVPVLVGSWTEEQERKILATLDPLAAMAEADKTALDSLLRDVQTGSEAVAKMLEGLATENGIIPSDTRPEAPEAEIDRAAELREKWQTETGQLWTIGKHRLLCGDSTKAEDVARLLGNGKPFIMVTDPPYGVEYDPDWRNEAAEKGLISHAASRVGKVENDGRIDWTDAYKLFPGHVAYVWHADRHAAELVVNLRNSSFEIRTQIIWKKTTFAISRGHYHWQHEPCWYAVRKGGSAKWCGDRSQSTVWDITLDKNTEGGHGTQKPVECMARPIRNHGDKGDLVYDPFLGSGTTLVACEREGRIGRGIEISPEYCAVILERLNKMGLECKRV